MHATATGTRKWPTSVGGLIVHELLIPYTCPSRLATCSDATHVTPFSSGATDAYKKYESLTPHARAHTNTTENRDSWTVLTYWRPGRRGGGVGIRAGGRSVGITSVGYQSDNRFSVRCSKGAFVPDTAYIHRSLWFYFCPPPPSSSAVFILKFFFK